MRLKWLIAFLAVVNALSIGRVQAAYVGTPPLLVTPTNAAGEIVGSSQPATLTLPVITQNLPPFALFPTPPPFLGKNAIFPDLFGRQVHEITDGVSVASIAPAMKGAAPANTSLVVSIFTEPNISVSADRADKSNSQHNRYHEPRWKANPRLQCSYIKWNDAARDLARRGHSAPHAEQVQYIGMVALVGLCRQR